CDEDRDRNEIVRALRQTVGLKRAEAGRCPGEESGGFVFGRDHDWLLGFGFKSVAYPPSIGPSENAVYLAKSRCCLPKYGSTHGSSGGHVHCVGGCRSRQLVGSGAPTKKTSRDCKPEGDGARGTAADQTVSSFEPCAGPD